ncbi:MAG: YjgP/YjgQ family permease [Candidatus Marinimicrobia bacterium]|jgi:lipopolysaccharide export system permease protein|nr:YjgP/YjgQ family permease [Candidatus Neomarinimicrobiota bacterium]MBT3947504.1 YjgP/YjgQ family permease [Candidatus Neomarinimicrobiota bacterium]MBT4308588.1 YjgP/YjgQ family permease [Candidatus Neomarinimicrobiota bacterium]MBT4453958.1 YjgP/YjgQ family permease [Candidatus Neomarinimicrobiota bacterium]MBT4736550.1 YjgP/YjgQ family permease [Candidatus Neomarinimicrobiota bacterium]
MKKLDLYLIRQFIVTLTMTLMGFLCVIIVVDLIENLDRFIDNAIPMEITLKYYIYAIPWFLNIGLPMSMMISTVFSIGLLAKRNELTAMKATGISLYRIAVPITTIGLIVSFISFELDNTWVSKGNQVRYNIEREYMKRRSRIKHQKDLRNVFLQKNEKTHISIGRYKVSTTVGRSITAISLEEGTVSKRLDARGIAWNDSLTLWLATDYSIREFNNFGEVKKTAISKGDTLINLNFTPQDITQQSKTPDEMSFADLTLRIDQLKKNGVDTTKWEVDRLFKISFAFTNLIVVLFGLPLVVMKSKGGLSFGAGMGIFVIFVYYAFIKFGMSMGYKGIMSPLVAAWLGNVIFTIGGGLLLVFSRK